MWKLAVLAAALCISACGGGSGSSQGADNPAEIEPTATIVDPTGTEGVEPLATMTPGGQSTPVAVPTATSDAVAATPTTTPAGPAIGPRITYFGVSRADDMPVPPSSSDGAGRPVYSRPLGSGLSLIVEAEPGPDGRPVQIEAYVAGGAPGLEMIVSRPLGDGNEAVCDNFDPLIGGVPAASPFRFSDDPPARAAIDDLACKVNDGTGHPAARFNGEQACTRIGPGREFGFVDARSRVQFCLPVAAAWGFSAGDTTVAARVRGDTGNLGAVSEMIVHIGQPAGTGTATVTRTATVTPATPLPSSTPTPTFTPLPPELGAAITYFGVARADDGPLEPAGTDGEGRPIYTRPVGQGLSIIVEAKRGLRPPRLDAYDPDGGAPGLQMILSRPIGNGSALVCDKFDPVFGGVGATVPFAFSDAADAVDRMNDLGCRVNDGTGQARARTTPTDACTRIGAGRDFDFADVRSEIQFCLPIAHAWAFPEGDTIVGARLADVFGSVGVAREIVVRIGD